MCCFAVATHLSLPAGSVLAAASFPLITVFDRTVIFLGAFNQYKLVVTCDAAALFQLPKIIEETSLSDNRQAPLPIVYSVFVCVRVQTQSIAGKTTHTVHKKVDVGCVGRSNREVYTLYCTHTRLFRTSCRQHELGTFFGIKFDQISSQKVPIRNPQNLECVLAYTSATITHFSRAIS